MKRLLATVAVALSAAAAAVAPAGATPTPPPIFPALAGVVRDACTGLPIVGATETLVPLAGQVPPTPIRLGGFFAYPGLAPGAYALGVAAPGYQSIPTGQTGDEQPGLFFQPGGVPILTPDPPPILPAGDTASVGLALDIQLPAG